MSAVGWFAAGVCAALLGQWLGMLWVARQRKRFYDDFHRRRAGGEVVSNLSHSAQAVLNAMHEINMDFNGENRALAAAALRAVADAADSRNSLTDVSHLRDIAAILEKQS